MKKLLSILIIFFTLLTSCFCDFDYNYMDDHDFCDLIMERLPTAFHDKNKSDAKKLFASKLYSISSFDNDLQDLIDYYEGETESIVRNITTGEHANLDYNLKRHPLRYKVNSTIDI